MDPVSLMGEGGRGRKRALQFVEGEVDTGVRLLEMADEALLAAVLSGEACLRAGAGGEEVALCTADRTFGLKRTDTSNILLLLDGRSSSGGGGGAPGTPGTLPAAGQPAPETPGVVTPPPAAAATPSPSAPSVTRLGTQWEGLATQQARAQGLEPLLVCATCVDTLETCPIAPDYGALRDLLDAHRFGAEEEDGTGGSGAGATGRLFPELLTVARLSEGKLRAWLRAEHYLELEGRWMAVDAAYLGTLLRLVLCEILQEGWVPAAVPPEGVVQAMVREGYRREVVENCLGRFFKPAESTVAAAEGAGDAGAAAEAETGPGEEGTGAGVGGGGGAQSLDFGAVCRFLAEPLFLEQPRWNLDKFSSRLREELVLDVELPGVEEFLGGLALVETVRKFGKDFKEVEYFPARALSSNPKDCFAALFQRRKNWRHGELQPYLVGLALPAEQTLDQEVAKWCYSFRENGDADNEQIYYRRW